LGGGQPHALASLRAAWEAVNNGWNQWVLNYTQSRQLDLLKNLGFESPSWEDLGYVLLGLLVAGVSLAVRLDAVGTQPARPLAAPAERARASAAKSRCGRAAHHAAAPAGRRAAQAPWGDVRRPLADWLLRLEACAMRGQRCQHLRHPRLATLQREVQPTGLAPVTPRFRLFAADCYFLIAALRSIHGGYSPKTTKKPKRPGSRRHPRASAGTAYATRADVMRAADDMAARRDLDPAWVRRPSARPPPATCRG
jgi:hypothetical protein